MFDACSRLSVGQLQGGASRGQVAQQLVASTEYQTDLIQADFRKYLGRAATAADVTCHCDTETFVLLMYGRLTPQAAAAHGRLVVEGDRRLLTVGKWFTGV